MLSTGLASAEVVEPEREFSEIQINQLIEKDIQIAENNTVTLEPRILGFVARIVLQNGPRFLKVFRSGAVVATHKLIINTQKQGKHILGHDNFVVGKSILRVDADELLEKYAGKGTMINQYKERVDFGKVIGEYYDVNKGHYLTTTKGIIHYSKTGAHIVPAKP